MQATYQGLVKVDLGLEMLLLIWGISMEMV